MRLEVFPDPLTYDYPEWTGIGNFLYRSHDIVSFGTPLTPDNVREAYKKGIFPWYTEGLPLPWHCPEWRTVLEFKDLKVHRSLAKVRRKNEFTFSIDRAFDRVVAACAKAYRRGQPGTWITPEFKRVYAELHRQGMAHSVETWDPQGRLVGGLYGVDAGGVFCGESMFFIEPNASKLALLHLIDHLRDRGSTWIDVQVTTSHLLSFGAKEINRREFLLKLKNTQDRCLDLFPKGTPAVQS